MVARGKSLRMSKHILTTALLFAFALTGFAKDKYTPIFDGKTLRAGRSAMAQQRTAWKMARLSARPRKAVRIRFLCTDKLYGNFDLKFEVKVDNGSNSGVQIRSQTKDGPKGRVNGPQVEIEMSGKNGAESGYIYGEAAGGWMTPADKRKPHKHFKDGEWNAYRVVAKGAHIQVWINGVQISDLVDKEKLKSHPKDSSAYRCTASAKAAAPSR